MQTPERHRQIKEVVLAALEREPSQRAAFLDEACQGDAALRAEVEDLLKRQDSALTFIEVPLLGESRTAALAQGTLVDGRYLIEKELGRGGMAIVFLARDQKLHQTQVVIKLLQETYREPEQREWLEEKFKKEIEALSRINHPGVVRALDVGGLPDGRAYLVMQYVPGVSLRSVMKPQGMELERAGKLLRQIGHALAAAHEGAIVHRDLKPENIMLQKTGDEEIVKLIDFGIATVLDTPTPTTIKTTAIVGTPIYMAPEQFHGKPSAASDVYAMGVIAYEMATGRPPFNAKFAPEIYALQQAGVKVKPCDLCPRLPAAAQTLILQALALSPQLRPRSARDFGEDLARILMNDAPPPKPTDSLEIGHVLFTDLVAYSSLHLDEQARQIRVLQEVVNGTAELQRAQMSNQLVRLPTGDGLALVFFGDPLAPVRCALEIAHDLKRYPEIKLRMGVHTGPVQRISDINQNVNVSGGGINLAQRVMDVGEAGHILLSKATADIVGQMSEWSKYLRDCGEYKAKHGVKLQVFNLHTGELGNPQPPGKTKALAARHNLAARKPLLLIAALLVVATIGVSAWLLRNSWGNANAPEQRLSYSLTLQKNPKRYPGSNPFVLPGETVFDPGDQVRLNVASLQAVYLYVINEGPAQTSGQPDYVVLFPNSVTNNGSAEVAANQSIQIPQPSREPALDWFIFDKEEGTEKIWLVWSEQSVPELETVKSLANPKERGVISDPNQIQSVARYLATHSTNKPAVERDETRKQTILSGRGNTLVGLVKLEHR